MGLCGLRVVVDCAVLLCCHFRLFPVSVSNTLSLPLPAAAMRHPHAVHCVPASGSTNKTKTKKRSPHVMNKHS